MLAPVERISDGGWVPPWIRYAHVLRYDWASTLAAGCSVLDAACGTGYGIAALLERGANRVIGLDLCAGAVGEAARRNTPGAQFLVADVTRLPLPDRSYDLFVSFETIEHLPDDRAYLREAARVLRPGGTFVCSTPNRTVTNPGITLADRPFNPHHLREYTRPELEMLLREYFASVHLLGQSYYGAGYVRLLTRIARYFPALAVRIHQARKLIGIPWEHPDRHRPIPLPPGGEPEYLVAVCRNHLGSAVQAGRQRGP